MLNSPTSIVELSVFPFTSKFLVHSVLIIFCLLVVNFYFVNFTLLIFHFKSYFLSITILASFSLLCV